MRALGRARGKRQSSLEKRQGIVENETPAWYTVPIPQQITDTGKDGYTAMHLKTEHTQEQARRPMPKRARVLLAAAAVLLCAVLAFLIYTGDYYHAGDLALETLRHPAGGVTITEGGGRIVFAPEHPEAGLIFYPGGKVQYESYAPLMERCAERSLLCVLLHMPGNLAVLDRSAAAGIPEEYPEISSWYIAGHSLGGVMAASYVKDHTETYRGLVLLASYATDDLSGSGLEVLSLYGTEDGVLDLERYDAARAKLPADFTELLIDGGCHAYFGSYGMQRGDGIPTISNEDQMDQAAEAIAAMARKEALIT